MSEHTVDVCTHLTVCWHHLLLCEGRRAGEGGASCTDEEATRSGKTYHRPACEGSCCRGNEVYSHETFDGHIHSTLRLWNSSLQLHPAKHLFTVTLSSPKWRNQWRTTSPRSPLSHKCHRSQRKLNPLPSRTASLLQHNKVRAFLWCLLILKVTRFETKLLGFCFSAEKPEDNQAPKPAKKKKARRETWDRSVCKRLPLRFMQHPFFLCQKNFD